MATQEAVEQRLHPGRRLGHLGPLLPTTQVTEAAQRHTAVGQLLPVLEAPAVIDRAGERRTTERRGGEHLEPRGADAAGEHGQDALEAAVHRHEHGAAAHLPTRRRHAARRDADGRRSLEEPRALGEGGARQGPAPGERLERRVGREEEAMPLRAVPRLDREAVGLHRLELGLAVGEFLRIGGDPERAGATDLPGCLRGDPVNAVQRRAVQRQRPLAAERRHRLVIEAGEPAQEEPPVPPRGALGHLAGVHPDHAAAARQEFERGAQPRPAETHHAHVGLDRPLEARESERVAVLPDGRGGSGDGHRKRWAKRRSKDALRAARVAPSAPPQRWAACASQPSGQEAKTVWRQPGQSTRSPTTSSAVRSTALRISPPPPRRMPASAPVSTVRARKHDSWHQYSSRWRPRSAEPLSSRMRHGSVAELRIGRPQKQQGSQ